MLDHSAKMPYFGQSALEARRPLAMSQAVIALSPWKRNSIKVVMSQDLGVTRKGGRSSSSHDEKEWRVNPVERVEGPWS